MRLPLNGWQDLERWLSTVEGGDPAPVTGSMSAQLKQRIATAHRSHRLLRSGDVALVADAGWLLSAQARGRGIAADAGRPGWLRPAGIDDMPVVLVAVHLPTASTIELVVDPCSG